MIRTYALAALAAATILATPAMSATELVTNGGFETVSNTNNFQVGGTGSAGTVTGWTVSSTGTLNNDPYNILFHTSIATTGNADGRFSWTGNEMLRGLPTNTTRNQGNFMALDGDGGRFDINGNFVDNVQGILQQTLTGLVVGNTYDLVFDWATGQLLSRSGGTSNTLNVQIGSLNTTYGPTSNPAGSPNSTPWVSIAPVQFQATGTSQVLSFLASGSPSGLPPMVLLDNVSVKAAVPEPGTWAMMLIGFGAVGASLRRRRRTTLAAAV